MTNWQQTGEQAAQLLSQYLQINTTNPPGNERQAAEYLADLFSQRGLDPKIYEPAPQRANLLVKIKGSGDGSKGPLLLLHHMDVVTADPDQWSYPPFSGQIADGYIYGRGAIDMKGFGIMHLAAIDRLRESQWKLDRDILFLAVADEETAGPFGAAWMIENHWNEIKPALVWDEGGFGLQGMVGSGLVFYVAVTEKQLLWPRLIAQGEPGLGSVPRGANPIDRLTRALERIRRHPFPPRLTEISKEMFKRLSAAADFPESFLLRHIDHPLIWPLVSRSLVKNPVMNASLRNLVTPTMLQGSPKQNVIPQTAQAGLDIRLLPDEDPQLFLQKLEQIIADKHIHLEVPIQTERSSISPFQPQHGGQFFTTLENSLIKHQPGATVVPMQTPGGSDSLHFRKRGVPAYGLIPIAIDQNELNRMHGIDERLSIDNLTLGTQIVYDVLKSICSP